MTAVTPLSHQGIVRSTLIFSQCDHLKTLRNNSRLKMPPFNSPLGLFFCVPGEKVKKQRARLTADNLKFTARCSQWLQHFMARSSSRSSFQLLNPVLVPLPAPVLSVLTQRTPGDELIIVSVAPPRLQAGCCDWCTLTADRCPQDVAIFKNTPFPTQFGHFAPT